MQLSLLFLQVDLGPCFGAVFGGSASVSAWRNPLQLKRLSLCGEDQDVMSEPAPASEPCWWCRRCWLKRLPCAADDDTHTRPSWSLIWPHCFLRPMALHLSTSHDHQHPLLRVICDNVCDSSLTTLNQPRMIPADYSHPSFPLLLLETTVGSVTNTSAYRQPLGPFPWSNPPETFGPASWLHREG